MKSFQRFLTESEAGVEYIVKILINGTEGDAYLECHQQCQWLNKDEGKFTCRLFQHELSVSGDEAKRPVRTKECQGAIEGLI